MRQTWRWFGPKDLTSIDDITQAGAAGVVSALHHVPNGVVWTPEEIARRHREIATRKDGSASGLTWDVVESLPVTEDIKKQKGDWREHIANYKISMKHLADSGIETICYNFMPVLDWTRTDLDYELPDGATALRFEFAAYAAFDLFVLEREGADGDYSPEDAALAKARFEALAADERDRLTANIIAGLPGAEESYTLESFGARLAAYRDVSREQLFANLRNFLDIVVPAAEEAGAVLAIHPDDPPRSLFGLPRIVSSLADLQRIAAMNPSRSNGFTVCAGSLGVSPDNDVPAIVEALGDRVHFAHLRATRREADPRSFHEDAHLEGDIDMIAIVRALRRLERRTGKVLPMRPDHGHRILNDLSGTSTPGYPAIGRLRGLAELRGVTRALDMLETQPV